MGCTAGTADMLGRTPELVVPVHPMELVGLLLQSMQVVWLSVWLGLVMVQVVELGSGELGSAGLGSEEFVGGRLPSTFVR